MERNSLFIGQSFEDVSLFESGKRQLSISEVCLVAIIWRFTEILPILQPREHHGLLVIHGELAAPTYNQ